MTRSCLLYASIVRHVPTKKKKNYFHYYILCRADRAHTSTSVRRQHNIMNGARKVKFKFLCIIIYKTLRRRRI